MSIFAAVPINPIVDPPGLAAGAAAAAGDARAGKLDLARRAGRPPRKPPVAKVSRAALHAARDGVLLRLLAAGGRAGKARCSSSLSRGWPHQNP